MQLSKKEINALSFEIPVEDFFMEHFDLGTTNNYELADLKAIEDFDSKYRVVDLGDWAKPSDEPVKAKEDVDFVTGRKAPCYYVRVIETKTEKKFLEKKCNAVEIPFDRKEKMGREAAIAEPFVLYLENDDPTDLSEEDLAAFEKWNNRTYILEEASESPVLAKDEITGKEAYCQTYKVVDLDLLRAAESLRAKKFYEEVILPASLDVRAKAEELLAEKRKAAEITVSKTEVELIPSIKSPVTGQYLVNKEIAKAASKVPYLSQDGKGSDALVIARYFKGPFTFYALEGIDKDTFYGLGIVHGASDWEYTFQSISKMAEAGVERDISVQPLKSTLGHEMRTYYEEIPEWIEKKEEKKDLKLLSESLVKKRLFDFKKDCVGDASAILGRDVKDPKEALDPKERKALDNFVSGKITKDFKGSTNPLVKECLEVCELRKVLQEKRDRLERAALFKELER